ncbi:CUB domain-containing protein, partial [Oryctes borbonicus]
CGSTEAININTLRNYTLQSPGYPDGYGHNLDCEWIFSTIPENHLQIDFYNVDLDYRFPCLYDHVEIYSGKNGVQDWDLLTNICLPNDTYRETIETTNLMKVAFKTDSYKNSTGFNAMITETCGGSVGKSSGIISVTNSTFSNLYSLRCQWNISVRTGRTIQIQFTVFDIGENADSKCNNYLLLRNGQSSSSPMLGDGKYCYHRPPTMQTTSNHLYVKFRTKTRVRGFTMKYNEVSINCGGTFSLSTLDNSTTISSPNYPNIPLPHTECKWLISAVPGESIQIDFIERFDLTDTLDCDKEYVEIRDGGTFLSPLIGRYCESMPSTIVSRDNMIFIKFFTDIEEPRNGFKLRASIAKCGGTIRDTTGEIRSRYFNNKKSYPKKENCTWEIVGPEGHFIIFSFETLDLAYRSQLCFADYVEIFEHSIIDYNNITSVGKYCYKNNDTDEIRTTSNKIQVRFTSSDRNLPAAGFLLKFTTSREKCGGSLENDFGIITSPRYPAIMFPTRCEWTIKVTKGKMIQVEILDLDFDTTRPSQGLAFSNSDNFAAHITFVKPNDKIKYINSTDNTMSVFFWAIHSSNHRGFKLRYTSDQPSICIADFSSPSGVIYSPQNCTYYHCIWKRVDGDASSRTLVLKISINNANNPGTSPLSSCKFTSSVTVTAGSKLANKFRF